MARKSTEKESLKEAKMVGKTGIGVNQDKDMRFAPQPDGGIDVRSYYCDHRDVLALQVALQFRDGRGRDRIAGHHDQLGPPQFDGALDESGDDRMVFGGVRSGD